MFTEVSKSGYLVTWYNYPWTSSWNHCDLGPSDRGFIRATVEMITTHFSGIFTSFLMFPAQFSERRENSHPETNYRWLVVGRARRLLWVHTGEPPGEGPGGVRPRGHVAGRRVLRQLRDPGTAFRCPARPAGGGFFSLVLGSHFSK